MYNDCSLSSFINRFLGFFSLPQPTELKEFSLLFDKPLQVRNIPLHIYHTNFRTSSNKTINSNNNMLSRVRQFLSNITSAWKHLSKDWLFHSLGHDRNISRPQSFPNEIRSQNQTWCKSSKKGCCSKYILKASKKCPGGGVFFEIR